MSEVGWEEGEAQEHKALHRAGKQSVHVTAVLWSFSEGEKLENKHTHFCYLSNAVWERLIAPVA